MAARQRPRQLFGPSDSPERGALPWNTADWTAVDDRVRGGSSTSQVALVNHNGDPAPQGELKFSGYLDTTTLGGAGFASQRRAAYPPFPFALQASAVSGITIRIRDRHVPSFDLPHPRRADPQHGKNDLQIQESIQNTQPGGGQGPVKVYNLNLYTSRPRKRQEDDRMEASVVYEGTFNVSDPTAVYPVSVGEPPNQLKISSDPVGAAVNMTYGPPTIYETISEFTLLWNAFHATYRGRPVPDAEPLDPSQIVNWSLMARSNFAEQSGPFALQLNSIWTVPSGNDTPEPQHPHAKRLADTEATRRSINDILTPDHITGSPGFALYVFATLLLVGWLLWAITPDALLKKLGVSWYPNREWAFLLPSFSLLVVVLAYIVYMAINLTMTPSLEDLSTIVDEHTNPPLVKRAGDMTFKEAEEYYKHQHPYGPGGNRRDMGGAMG